MTHRDIHPSNIMICHVNHSYVGKISNLALSKEFKPNSSKQSVSQEFKANGFVAPELYDSNGPYNDGVDTAVDIFSMGSVIFYALTGQYLFAQNGTEMQDNIRDKRFKPKYETLSPSNTLMNWQVEFAKQLIKKMVMRGPHLRPTASNVLNHPLFWSYEMIANFFGSVSGYAGGDVKFQKILDGNLQYKDWYKQLVHDEMKHFVDQSGKNQKGAWKLLRFARNLVIFITTFMNF